ncbi:MAG: YggS family pyridoxal phosphate-dependent enzyme [Spirochaetales bacterium]|nr:YggS family pyridoxal phosphate-dependent enzyme [Spirochaetales bacterium]
MPIIDNWKRIQDLVSETLIRCGRNPDSVKIMAVSKTQPLEAVLEAYDAGIRLFGENRVLEGIDKFSHFQNTLLVRGIENDSEVHLIGHLQRNKAKLAPFFNCIQSIDKKETAEALMKNMNGSQKLDIFLEVNTSDENTKSGVHSFDELANLTDFLLSCTQFKIRGLMTIAPFVDDEKTVRASFSSLRDMSERLLSRYPELESLELSMGMSDDFRYAIMEGSTLIRAGTAIFGKRNYNQ